ncbi:GatB/YqeY domain-containing protein [Myroides sp. LJL116]
MSLQSKITDAIKSAMKAKDTLALESLRAIKSELLLAQTQAGAQQELNDEQEIKILQRLVKQRRDSAAIFTEQGRADLAEPEIAQAVIIEGFLPKQLTPQEVEQIIKTIILEGDFSSMASMGQVMGLASKELAGKADGKTISTIVKALLTK